MNGFSVFFIYIGLFLLIAGVGYADRQARETKARAEAIKQIKAVNGKVLEFKRLRLNSRDTIDLEVSYIDFNGQRQRRAITKHNRGDRPIMWDQPIDLAAPVMSETSQSKEQIISDLSAEIQRLQRELASK